MLSIADPSPSEAEAPPPADIRGVVDNVNADRLCGWVWNASQPEERVAVELRLGGETVLRTIADFARPDLPRAGIGDGNHAFELRLEPEWIERRSELSVVAAAADGTETTLPIRVRAKPEVTAALTYRGVESILAAQRQLREDLRSVAARLPREATTDLIQRVATAQERLEDRLNTLEVWLARLDERLAAQGEDVRKNAPVRRMDTWQVVLAVTLGFSATAALAAAHLLLGG